MIESFGLKPSVTVVTDTIQSDLLQEKHGIFQLSIYYIYVYLDGIHIIHSNHDTEI